MKIELHLLCPHCANTEHFDLKSRHVGFGPPTEDNDLDTWDHTVFIDVPARLIYVQCPECLEHTTFPLGN